jgi:hypothetical protein
LVDHLLPLCRLKSRFIAEGKSRSDLNSLGAKCKSIGQSLGFAKAACHPEGCAQVSKHLKIWNIFRAVDRLVVLVENHCTTRRRVVTACGWPFDNKTINWGCDFFEKSRGQD